MATHKASPRNRTLSIPSTVGQNSHKMPPNHGRIYGHEGALPTGNWHLLSASTKIESGAAAAAGLQYPLKGVQGGDQE